MSDYKPEDQPRQPGATEKRFRCRLCGWTGNGAEIKVQISGKGTNVEAARAVCPGCGADSVYIGEEKHAQ